MSNETEATPPTRAVDPQFEVLLEFLRDDRGFDFTGYKRASLQRRIQRRMQEVSVSTYSDYMDFLQVHPEEFTAVFNTILINVTSFFRDREAWDDLGDRVLPGLVEKLRPSENIRVWSAGTASGAEAYSVAMLLAERLGLAEFRDRVKIYATDVDEDALAEARQGTFRETQVHDVPPELLERWFERQPGGGHTVSKDLRRCVIFGRNDLVQDAPISKVDLLLCRNTLMYLNAETQERVLRRFHFALKDSGVLFLGKAETLLTRSQLFVPIEARHRLFRRVPSDPTLPAGRFRADGSTLADDGLDAALLTRAFDVSDQAMLVLDPSGSLVRANQRAVSLFGLGPSSLGRSFRELDASVRPFDLRPMLDRVGREGQDLTLEDVEWSGDVASYWRIRIAPIRPDGLGADGCVVFFDDVTATHDLQADLSYANKQLETSYEELQSTVEELETTNEELQSTVEELETTNEELQSTNEELETTNEELQSTNDELHAANEELSERSAQVASVNGFLDSILRSFDAAVIVVDRDFHVSAWSAPAEKMWGLRADEVIGQHLMNLDTGLPLDVLYPTARRVLAGSEPEARLDIPAVNRRGRSILAATRVAPLADALGETTGVILFITEAPPEP